MHQANLPLSLMARLLFVSQFPVLISIFRERKGTFVPVRVQFYENLKSLWPLQDYHLYLFLWGLLRVVVLVYFRNRSVSASDFAHPGVAFIRVGLGLSHVTRLLYSVWMRLCSRRYVKKASSLGCRRSLGVWFDYVTSSLIALGPPPSPYQCSLCWLFT